MDFPLSQKLQNVNPANSAYFPDAQTEQDAELGLDENLPFVQSTQAATDDDPELAFALPATQSVQRPPAPSWLNLPISQGKQSETEVDPTIVVDFPKPHEVH
jgi:hypothetical protein